ncbi:flavodoxin-dependent (E)-4-hydroxy-3-methylbut-2-enyl-diphosphate synthase [Dehalococcoides mccartyi]|jgi:4-hydroxy-3-methylbut-2-en-1-yl diphosphate synthase (EC 1.17.4.3)|uniref:flavodoxin-dependent (E)-4-hydroxy-3-methylbut-2-enyl-diphosphate synthase n=1 Tax=Dehalococcoides mccartyi TaxID=61435 RepID=UPI0001BDD454|nr:flavodoxin-dependent (E)-4-hydroxy-3-methylbut-2-enyl-diphosphate synthase [Dehalococcoides mccartyi]AQU05465.1 4-hydroxy-3-methylbut-2-en-1-yl diphosphate synthase (flavodoxin) [Dehalococcoides mccartyi]AQU06910.1 4-hydroxy-3-methylbut-2-en-1-yl diphosphate synthase (flavodoxin) [Dehalococcoides mccartyi]AQX72818.1 4-hydroxy-3-methylbut-2-en-1-yl diphosphate synthase (flavodoxin) [Dehalococcoides mccartyi]AQX74194.1 4-hydroxy-3-methylbut-2-en-1-yl diphosphate synthase (flavodoxin) [Dehaloco
MITRRQSTEIRLGNLTIGGSAPISVQSMTKTDTRNIPATIAQIKELEECGCEIIRLAIPDMEASSALKSIRPKVKIPIVADIHFDYRLALASLSAGVDGLRLNPGNIGDPERVKAVVKSAKEREIPIRIGVNAGSLPKDLPPELTIAQKMVKAAMGHIKILEGLDFGLIKVSLKAFDVPTTIEAYTQIASLIPYPLHVGITETGTPKTGLVRSAVGIGNLLYMGIGDTIRVSLTAPPQEEVFAAYEILKSLNLRQRGPILVSCPTCSRTEVDIVGIASRVQEALNKIDKPIRVAVMGCAVNGPGEAKEADLGIACGKGQGLLFRKGEKIAVVPEDELVDALLREIASL